MSDALAEAESRAAELAAAQKGGRFPYLGVSGAAVLELMLEIIAEAVTDQDLRMQAMEREVALLKEESALRAAAFKEELEAQAAAFRRAWSDTARIARLEHADHRTHPE